MWQLRATRAGHRAGAIDSTTVEEAVRHPVWMLVLAIGCGAASLAHADDAPPVDEVVARARQRAPALLALHARAAAAQEEVGAAGVLPDPMLEFVYQDVNFPSYTVGEEEMSMIGVELRQTLPFFGKRGARRAAAQAQAILRTSESAEMERLIVLEVRRLYAQLYAVDRATESLDAAAELLAMLEAAVTARYGTGQAELVDALKTQLARSRLRERRDDLGASRAALAAALNRYLDERSPIGRVASLPEPEPLRAGWDTLALRTAPRVLARAAAVTAAAERAQAARKERPPDLYVGAGYSYRGDFDHLATFRIGMDLPFWRGRRTQPLIRAAEHELEMARSEQGDAEAMTHAVVTRLAAAWSRSQAQLDLYREAIVPQAGTVLDAARNSYVAGRGDFPAVIEGFEVWLESRLQLANREAERFTTWAEIDALLTPSHTEGQQ